MEACRKFHHLNMPEMRLDLRRMRDRRLTLYGSPDDMEACLILPWSLLDVSLGVDDVAALLSSSSSRRALGRGEVGESVEGKK